MPNFADLVTKLMTDPTFAANFHNKASRPNALMSIGIDPNTPGLQAELNNINYTALDNLRNILDPNTVHFLN